MLKYQNKHLRKGKHIIHVLFYIAPSKDQRKTPCGSRHGKYACEVDGKPRYILTHNISRYVVKNGYILEDELDEICWLHAQHSSKHQENCQTKEIGLWHRFLNLFR